MNFQTTADMQSQIFTTAAEIQVCAERVARSVSFEDNRTVYRYEDGSDMVICDDGSFFAR